MISCLASFFMVLKLNGSSLIYVKMKVKSLLS